MRTIPTTYAGKIFRSKLEADWAACFDRLGIQWLYEVEGYQLDNGTYYLPDFFLPQIKTLFEVKGILDEENTRKYFDFCKEMTQKDKDYWTSPEICIMMGGPEGTIYYFTEQEQYCAWLGKCAICKKCWFLSSFGSYHCRNCGAHDGKHNLTIIAEDRIPEPHFTSSRIITVKKRWTDKNGEERNP